MRHLLRIVLPAIVLFILIAPLAANAQFAQAREKARQSQCMNNVRQLTIAVQMYMQDADGLFPDAATIWEDLAFPPRALSCPTYGDENGIGYGYNFWIGGRSMDGEGMPEPQELVVLADSSAPDHLLRSERDIDNRHSGKAIIGYADGHVALRPSDQVEIKPIYDIDLLEATVKEWPDGRKALCALDLGPEGDALKQAPPADWVSPLFTDPRQFGGDKGGLTMVRDLALSLSGRPNAKWDAYTGDPKEVFCRIPIPADARAIADNGRWMLCLPALRFWFSGGSPRVTAPADAPEIRGYSEISVLDDQEQPIAVFRLELAGTEARYLLNGRAMVKQQDAAILNTRAGYENRYCYRFSNLVHNLLLTGDSEGTVRCHLSAGASELSGSEECETQAGNIQAPAWIQLRVSTWSADKSGEGALYIWTRKQDGGMLWSRMEFPEFGEDEFDEFDEVDEFDEGEGAFNEEEFGEEW